MKTLLEAQMEQMTTQVKEIFARQRRMETMLYKIAEASGVANPKESGKVVMRTSTSVEIAGLDTPIGHIKRALEETSNYPPQDLVGVYFRDVLIAEIDFIT